MREQNQKSTDTFTTTRPRDNVSLPILKYKWGGGQIISVPVGISTPVCIGACAGESRGSHRRPEGPENKRTPKLFQSFTEKHRGLIWEQQLKLGAVLPFPTAGGCKLLPPPALSSKAWGLEQSSLLWALKTDPQGLSCRKSLHTKEKPLGVKAKFSKIGKNRKKKKGIVYVKWGRWTRPGYFRKQAALTLHKNNRVLSSCKSSLKSLPF